MRLIAGFDFPGRINMTALFSSLSRKEEFFKVFSPNAPFSQWPHCVLKWALHCTDSWLSVDHCGCLQQEWFALLGAGNPPYAAQKGVQLPFLWQGRRLVSWSSMGHPES